jgi:hypothetical protein
MKPYGKVSSLRDANTLLWGQQNKDRTQKTEERSHKGDEQEMKAPEQRNQDRFETQRQRVITLCKKRLQ